MLLDSRSFRPIQKDAIPDGVFTNFTDSLEKIQSEALFKEKLFPFLNIVSL